MQQRFVNGLSTVGESTKGDNSLLADKVDPQTILDLMQGGQPLLVRATAFPEYPSSYYIAPYRVQTDVGRSLVYCLVYTVGGESCAIHAVRVTSVPYVRCAVAPSLCLHRKQFSPTTTVVSRRRDLQPPPRLPPAAAEISRKYVPARPLTATGDQISRQEVWLWRMRVAHRLIAMSVSVSFVSVIHSRYDAG